MPMGKKVSLFEPVEKEEKMEYPKEINIKKVDDGFIVRKMGGKMDYHEGESVAKEINDVVDKLKAHLA